MSTRATVRDELRRRLGDYPSPGAVWDDNELNGFIETAIGGLYPTYFLFDQNTTTAGAGPIQPAPSGARNIYHIGIVLPGSVRTHSVLSWEEGNGQVYLPVTSITGATLVWSWTKGFTVPSSDGTTLDVVPEALEVLILRSHITAIENLLSDRMKTDKFFALNIRQGVTEQDLATLLDALHSSLNKREERVIPLPKIVK